MTRPTRVSWSACRWTALLLACLSLARIVCGVETWVQTLSATSASSVSLLQSVDGGPDSLVWSGDIQVGLDGNVTLVPASTETMAYFLYPGATANFSDLPSSLSAYVSTNTTSYTRDLLSLVADGVWFATPFATRPLRRYISSLFACDLALPSLAFEDRVVQCTGEDPLLSLPFNLTLTSSLAPTTRGQLFPINMTVAYTSESAVASATVRAEAQVVLFHRLTSYLEQFNAVSDSAHANTSRRNNARIAVGFLWSFAALVLLFLCLMVASFQSWLYPLFPPSVALFVWAALLIGLSVGISIGTGIVGFIVLLCIFAIYSFAVGLLHYILRLSHRETPPPSDEQKGLLAPAEEIPDQRGGRNKGRGAEGQVQMVRTRSQERAARAASSSSLVDPATGVVVSGPDARLAVAAEQLDAQYAIHPYATKPHRMGYVQRRCLGATSMLFLTSLVVCVALFGIWRVEDYIVVDRQGELPLQPPIVEYIPQTVAKGVEAIYAFDGYATRLHLDSTFFHAGTEWCGAHYSSQLDTDDERYNAIEVGYIEKYGVDMSLFIPSSYTQFNSVNAWFTRHFNLTFRPVASGPTDIASPAEARVTVWNNNPEGVKFWIKGNAFTMAEFLTSAVNSSQYNGGTLVLLRLAPQDYHRFHAPLASTLLQQFQVEGSLQSVNSDGMTSRNYAIYNQRTVMIFDSPLVGEFAYVAIGALCVGSVHVPSPNDTSIPAPPGTTYDRGDSLGYFEFGGSTIALVFQPGTVRFEDDLVFASQRRVETLLQVRTRLAVGLQGSTEQLTPT